MLSLVSPVIMSKMVEVNSPYFMSILAAQNNKPKGDDWPILPLPTPAGVVLRSGMYTVSVCNLHLPYTERYVYDIVYSQHFVIECIHLFLSSKREKKNGYKVIYFITTEWLIVK